MVVSPTRGGGVVCSLDRYGSLAHLHKICCSWRHAPYIAAVGHKISLGNNISKHQSIKKNWHIVEARNNRAKPCDEQRLVYGARVLCRRQRTGTFVFEAVYRSGLFSYNAVTEWAFGRRRQLKLCRPGCARSLLRVDDRCSVSSRRKVVVGWSFQVGELALSHLPPASQSLLPDPTVPHLKLSAQCTPTRSGSQSD